ncbi:E3 Ubiquitin-Protein Ligase Amfr [Manis pentadactyla]|nr:E3 Ubiquitin-Protein Ligase Amfr [Manis pentadactyla]
MSSHGRVLSLLTAMLLSCCGLVVVCCITGYTHGMHTLSFMAAESLLVTVRTAHVILRYVIHLWDLNHEGTWEGKGTYDYYTDFVMELILLSLDLMHHIHMLSNTIVIVTVFAGYTATRAVGSPGFSRTAVPSCLKAHLSPIPIAPHCHCIALSLGPFSTASVLWCYNSSLHSHMVCNEPNDAGLPVNGNKSPIS